MTQQQSHSRPAPHPSFNQPRPQSRVQNGSVPSPGRGRPQFPAPSTPRQAAPSGIGRGGKFLFTAWLGQHDLTAQ